MSGTKENILNTTGKPFNDHYAMNELEQEFNPTTQNRLNRGDFTSKEKPKPRAKHTNYDEF